MQVLFTPWRYRYVSMGTGSDECFFCQAAARPDDPECLVVHLTDHHVVLLNRHPYTNGHVMVAPREHCSDPGACSEAASREFWPLINHCVEVLRKVYGPEGLNLGMNLGSTAGAGVPDHCHFHVVPRWQGDTSFMSVVGQVRLIPEELGETRERLRRVFSERSGDRDD